MLANYINFIMLCSSELIVDVPNLSAWGVTLGVLFSEIGKKAKR
jgi:hypothetical protein